MSIAFPNFVFGSHLLACCCAHHLLRVSPRIHLLIHRSKTLCEYVIRSPCIRLLFCKIDAKLHGANEQQTRIFDKVFWQTSGAFLCQARLKTPSNTAEDNNRCNYLLQKCGSAFCKNSRVFLLT